MTPCGKPRISLLHATFRRPGGPLEVQAAWLAAADRPDLVEYVVALDADDEATVAVTTGERRVVGPPLPGRVTAVRNWNAAAAAASADLMTVVADDLFPRPGWDSQLLALVAALDPRATPFVVKVADNLGEGDVLLRHPVVSRAHYERHGLFSDAYDGVFCDLDLTTRAFWRSAIVDGRSVVLDHRHPDLSDLVVASESQRRINATEQYEQGRRTYEGSWSGRQRSVEIRLVRADPGRPLDERTLLRRQRWNRARTDLAYLRHLTGRGLWLLAHPRHLVDRLRSGGSGKGN